jgi:hypothetical protein
MSNTINDGGPAYPCHTNPLPGKLANAPQGMTLRDYFAGQALTGLLTQPAEPEYGLRYFARSAYLMADEMLKAREVKP